MSVSSDSLVLVEYLQQGMIHEDLIQLLELLERVLVVLTGALRQDVHLEVCIGHLLLVVLLVRCRILLTLPLKGLL